MLTDAQVAQARGWVSDGVPKAEVARRLGMGRTTLYTYLADGVGTALIRSSQHIG